MKNRNSAASPTKSFKWTRHEGAVRLIFKAYLKVVHRIRIEGLEKVPKARKGSSS